MAISSAVIRLVGQAAQQEPYPARWETRFAHLFETGVLHLPKQPGTEMALHIRELPFANDVGRIVNFCIEHMQIAQRNKCLLNVDLNQVQTKSFTDWLMLFQTELANAISDGELNTANLLFSLQDDHPGIRAFLDLRHSSVLGYPAIAIRYGNSLLRYEHSWQVLVAASHEDVRIKLVPAMAVRPLSGLHMFEQGDCVMPNSLFEVSTDTAWLMLEIDATCLGPPVKMKQQLSDCLRFADNLIDQVLWPRPALQLDALLNRRVGIHISCLGDLLCQQGMHPGKVETFHSLKRWLAFVRCCFVHESMFLARRRGPFPELGATELIAELTPRYGVSAARRLIQNRSLRHRHILAFSPFALFPRKPAAYADELWLNLIPALGCADALTMFGPDPRARLSLQAWRRLLQMTGALGACDAEIIG
ncbi:MAG: hypothetical protein GY727_03105 [Gammaproteobacteria bacterium]|nr:hypothetical protein [Gammaproteobacteria bacterium]MCP4089959.1 hypothetical protein [Gammaproteobacteria bacterium]MCP4276290.1 hypothetical protein [Gammaproteobacteria bacterium]MCP4831285.1 hypothetical protein [Gammaproteobacteria bacterium]MCP4928768.1 hypothetical protein [Gammaproteobacteria bacterium]